MKKSEPKIPDSPSNARPTRGQRLWQAITERRHNAGLSLHRAGLLTDSYRETEGQPAAIRKAKAFADVVKGPLYLMDDDLLAGAFAARPMAPEVYPEYDSAWMLEDLDSGGLADLLTKQDQVRQANRRES